MNNKIKFQMHIMWYEAEMINETLDSIANALKHSKSDVDINLCVNIQTYIEKPLSGTLQDMVDKFINHPLIDRCNVIYKTNDDEFYNIADWRREQYYEDFKYTVWGESDTLLPYDFFYILENLDIKEPHLLSFSSRKMWDNSWNIVTHSSLAGWSAPCQCGTTHRSDCIELMEEPLKYKDIINQKQLDEFNDKSDDVDIVKLDQIKVDGSILSLSGGLPNPFISEEHHFVREDTSAAMFLEYHKIPQYHITNRIKGHNYWHPRKRTNTEATREDDIFKKYADESVMAMNKFLGELNET